MEPGKLFVGGISWDTNEDRLREYFETFGEVVEAVIMKDRTTGRARGFGFIIYADPAVAERVVRQKHMLDGRTVEAKKAVPRDDQQILSKNTTIAHGSPSLTRTKKIFVGGLASNVTESDFKRYFDQFGMITDVVVMYDHNTQRPRGFGFITFDSEEAVDRVLFRTFHELNGKMVEVKRAVPKEMSPGPSRGQFSPNYGLNRVNSFLNGYTQGYNPSLVGGFGVRMNDRHSPVGVSRSGFPSFGPMSYGSPLNNELRVTPSMREASNFISSVGYDRGLSAALYNGNMKWNDNVIENDGGSNRGNASSFNSNSWSLWGNESNGSGSYSTALNGLRNGDNGAGTFNRIEAIWGSSPMSGHTGGSSSPSSIRGGINYSRTEDVLGSTSGVNGLASSSFTGMNGSFDANFQELYEGNGGHSWLSSTPVLKASTSFEHGLGNAASEVPHKNPALCW